MRVVQVKAIHPHYDKALRRDRSRGEKYDLAHDSAERRVRAGLIEILEDKPVVPDITETPGPDTTETPGPDITETPGPDEGKFTPEEPVDPRHAAYDAVVTEHGKIEDAPIRVLEDIGDAYGINEDNIEGTGARGRIIKADWLKILKKARG